MSGESCINCPENFFAGKVSQNFDKWEKLTSDGWLLDIVMGYKLELNKIPEQRFIPQPIKFCDREIDIINQELQKFLHKGVVEECVYEKEQYVSNIFIRPKRDGSHRVILNLKTLNKDMDKVHFKMESLKSAMALMQENCYLASVDLKDAYYTVNVKPEDRKYLRFVWDNTLYQFTCLPNGLTTAPRVFTKLLKPVFAHLRTLGLASVVYLDDTLLQGQQFSDCLLNVSKTVKLLDSLGFTVHPKKSVLKPSQQIEFLGFILNSRDMTVRLTQKKAESLVNSCRELGKKQTCTIRELAEIIGKMVASEPGNVYAPLHYKQFEIEKNKALKTHKGNFDAVIQVSHHMVQELYWWINELGQAKRSILLPKPSVEMFSDSSSTGWGGVCGDSKTGGLWSSQDKSKHINELEMKACLLTLTSLCDGLRDIHIRAYLDNTTSVTYIEKMGGTKEKLNNICKEIWGWCNQRNIWLSAVHIPGIENVEADRISRENHTDLEWKLDPQVFVKVCEKLGQPQIDMFASRKNFQMLPYVSYKPDSGAVAVNAFKLNWQLYLSYMFPPFSILGRVLQKLQEDEAQAVLIAPLWPTQVWFTKLLGMICSTPVLLPHSKKILMHPGDASLVHPLHASLKLMACRVSGRYSQTKAYQMSLPELFLQPGEDLPRYNIGAISENGVRFAIGQRLITFVHLR